MKLSEKRPLNIGSSNIRFCDDCNSMMYLKQQGENNSPKYACSFCAYKHFAIVAFVSMIIIILIGAFMFVFYLLVFK